MALAEQNIIVPSAEFTPAYREDHQDYHAGCTGEHYTLAASHADFGQSGQEAEPRGLVLIYACADCGWEWDRYQRSRAAEIDAMPDDVEDDEPKVTYPIPTTVDDLDWMPF